MTSRIDDSAADNVTLEGGWGLRESRTAFENTVAVSDRVSDKITARFNGTAIEVWGSAIASNQAARVIVVFDLFIDGQFEERYSRQFPLELELQISRLWASRELPFGNHTLELEIFELENAAAVIDYFQVFASGEPPLEVASISPSLSSTTPSAAVHGSANRTQTPSSDQAYDAAEAPIGPIVGGVIGSMFLLVLLGLAFFSIRRRRQRRERGKPNLMPFDKLEDTPVPIPIWHRKDRPSTPVTQTTPIPLFTPSQSKMRPPESLFLNPLLIPPQPKVRIPTNHYSTPPISPISSNPAPPASGGNPGSSRVDSMPPAGVLSNPAYPSDTLHVEEAIRTLQTYLQRQPEGLGQVVQGLGVSTSSDGVEGLRSPPPAYEERR